VTATYDSVNQASQRVNQASTEVAGIRSQVVVVSKKQRDEKLKVRQIGGKLLQITQLVAHVQQDLQHHDALTGGGRLPSSAPPRGAFGSEWHPR
jgi:hypothetical protein